MEVVMYAIEIPEGYLKNALGNIMTFKTREEAYAHIRDHSVDGWIIACSDEDDEDREREQVFRDGLEDDRECEYLGRFA